MTLDIIMDVVVGIVTRVGRDSGCYLDIFEEGSGCEIRNFSEFGWWEVMIVTPDIVEDFIPSFISDVLDYKDTFESTKGYSDNWEFNNIPDVIRMIKSVPEWEELVNNECFLHYTTQDIVDLYNSRLRFTEEEEYDSAR